MRKFTINCDFGGQLAPFVIYIGQPEPGHHPLHFQADWLSKQRGGTIPQEVMEAVTKLQELSVKNNVSLEELCVYALGTPLEQEEADARAGIQNSSDEEGDESSEEIKPKSNDKKSTKKIKNKAAGDIKTKKTKKRKDKKDA